MPELIIDPRLGLSNLYELLRHRLDWVPPIILDMANSFSSLQDLGMKKSVKYSLVRPLEFRSHLDENKDFCSHNLYAFLTYLANADFRKDISFGASAGILTRESAAKLLESSFLKDGIMNEMYYSIHSNCLTLSYDGGKPFLYKGIYKRKHLEDNNFFYFVIQ